MQGERIKMLRRCERLNELIVVIDSFLSIYDINRGEYIFAAILTLSMTINFWVIVGVRNRIREIENE